MNLIELATHVLSCLFLITNLSVSHAGSCVILQIHYICKTSIRIMSIHCECGICGHVIEQECVAKECGCCTNFHVRSG